MKKKILIVVIIIFIFFFIFKTQQRFENFQIKPKGINSFSKILYINLKHREDRNKQILNEFEKIGIKNSKIKRIDAIKENYNGHIGCCKSHIKCLEHAKKKNYKNVVIFEDDFVFTKEKEIIDRTINHFLKDFKSNWDVIMLTTVHKSLEPIENYKYVKNVNSATTSSSYIIQKHFYDKLIEKLKFCLEKMETEMKEWSKNNPGKKKKTTSWALDQCWGSLQKQSKWYIFNPYLGKQGGDAGQSSIMGSIENFVGFYRENFKGYSLKL